MSQSSQAGKTMNAVKANVVSISKDGHTVKVEIPTVVQDKMYGKRLHRVTTLLVDSGNTPAITVGAVVSILPSRRISKNKSWKIVGVVAVK